MPRESIKCRNWEKERRNRLNASFSALAKLLPCYDPSVNISKIAILEKAKGTIEDLQIELKKLLSPPVDNNNPKDDIFKKLQDRIKKLLIRNEQLNNLLRDAGISSATVVGTIKKFKKPLPMSNKVSSEEAAIFQKHEREKDSPSNMQAQNKKRKVKLVGTCVAPKHRSPKARTPKIANPRKKSTNSVPTSNCLLVLSQPTPVRAGLSQPCYLITNEATSGSKVQTTKNGIQAKPIISTSFPRVSPPLSTLGPGTLILANGTIVPIISQPQILIPSSTLITKPAVHSDFTTITAPKTAKKKDEIGKKNTSQIQEMKRMPRLQAKPSLTTTTQVNKVPIPALTSRYANSCFMINNAKTKLSGIKQIGEKGKNIEQKTTNTAQMETQRTPKRKNALTDEVATKKFRNASNNKNTNSSLAKTSAELEKTPLLPTVSATTVNIENVSVISTTNDALNLDNIVCKTTSSDLQIVSSTFDSSEVFNNKKKPDLNSNANIKENQIVSEEEFLNLSTSEISEKEESILINSSATSSRITTYVAPTTITTVPEKLETELNISHSAESDDLFVSCQNPESTSPTAAFLLAFPLVSAIKSTEIIDEDDTETQRETPPTLLQIGIMDSTKPTGSNNFGNSLLNLDNLPFFTSKNVCGNYHNSYISPVDNKGGDTNNKVSTSAPNNNAYKAIINGKVMESPKEAEKPLSNDKDKHSNMLEIVQEKSTNLDTTCVINSNVIIAEKPLSNMAPNHSEGSTVSYELTESIQKISDSCTFKEHGSVDESKSNIQDNRFEQDTAKIIEDIGSYKSFTNYSSHNGEKQQISNVLSDNRGRTNCNSMAENMQSIKLSNQSDRAQSVDSNFDKHNCDNNKIDTKCSVKENIKFNMAKKNLLSSSCAENQKHCEKPHNNVSLSESIPYTNNSKITYNLTDSCNAKNDSAISEESKCNILENGHYNVGKEKNDSSEGVTQKKVNCGINHHNNIIPDDNCKFSQETKENVCYKMQSVTVDNCREKYDYNDKTTNETEFNIKENVLKENSSFPQEIIQNKHNSNLQDIYNKLHNNYNANIPENNQYIYQDKINSSETVLSLNNSYKIQKVNVQLTDENKNCNLVDNIHDSSQKLIQNLHNHEKPLNNICLPYNFQKLPNDISLPEDIHYNMYNVKINQSEIPNLGNDSGNIRNVDARPGSLKKLVQNIGNYGKSDINMSGNIHYNAYQINLENGTEMSQNFSNVTGKPNDTFMIEANTKCNTTNNIHLKPKSKENFSVGVAHNMNTSEELCNSSEKPHKSSPVKNYCYSYQDKLTNHNSDNPFNSTNASKTHTDRANCSITESYNMPKTIYSEELAQKIGNGNNSHNISLIKSCDLHNNINPVSNNINYNMYQVNISKMTHNSGNGCGKHVDYRISRGNNSNFGKNVHYSMSNTPNSTDRIVHNTNSCEISSYNSIAKSYEILNNNLPENIQSNNHIYPVALTNYPGMTQHVSNGYEKQNTIPENIHNNKMGNSDSTAVVDTIENCEKLYSNTSKSENCGNPHSTSAFNQNIQSNIFQSKFENPSEITKNLGPAYKKQNSNKHIMDSTQNVHSNMKGNGSSSKATVQIVGNCEKSHNSVSQNYEKTQNNSNYSMYQLKNQSEMVQNLGNSCEKQKCNIKITNDTKCCVAENLQYMLKDKPVSSENLVHNVMNSDNINYNVYQVRNLSDMALASDKSGKQKQNLDINESKCYGAGNHEYNMMKEKSVSSESVVNNDKSHNRMSQNYEELQKIALSQNINYNIYQATNQFEIVQNSKNSCEKPQGSNEVSNDTKCFVTDNHQFNTIKEKSVFAEKLVHNIMNCENSHNNRMSQSYEKPQNRNALPKNINYNMYQVKNHSEIVQISGKSSEEHSSNNNIINETECYVAGNPHYNIMEEKSVSTENMVHNAMNCEKTQNSNLLSENIKHNVYVKNKSETLQNLGKSCENTKGNIEITNETKCYVRDDLQYNMIKDKSVSAEKMNCENNALAENINYSMYQVKNKSEMIPNSDKSCEKQKSNVEMTNKTKCYMPENFQYNSMKEKPVSSKKKMPNAGDCEKSLSNITNDENLHNNTGASENFRKSSNNNMSQNHPHLYPVKLGNHLEMGQNGNIKVTDETQSNVAENVHPNLMEAKMNSSEKSSNFLSMPHYNIYQNENLGQYNEKQKSNSKRAESVTYSIFQNKHLTNKDNVENANKVSKNIFHNALQDRPSDVKTMIENLGNDKISKMPHFPNIIPEKALSSSIQNMENCGKAKDNAKELYGDFGVNYGNINKNIKVPENWQQFNMLHEKQANPSINVGESCEKSSSGIKLSENLLYRDLDPNINNRNCEKFNNSSNAMGHAHFSEYQEKRTNTTKEVLQNLDHNCGKSGDVNAITVKIPEYKIKLNDSCPKNQKQKSQFCFPMTYPSSSCNFNYRSDSSTICPTCSCLNLNRNYTNPLYTNSSNYNYNYPETNISQNYFKSVIPRNSTKTYYPLGYENCPESTKFYENSSNYQKDNGGKLKGVIQNKPVNWMTTPDSKVPTTGCFLPPFSNQSYSFNSCITSVDANDTNSIVQPKKNIDIPVGPDGKQFSWSPTKLPNFLDPSHNFVTPTLPTLVGDLALGNTLTGSEQKNEYKYPKELKHKSVAFENQANFLSVSQLVDHNKPENMPARTATRRNSGNRVKAASQGKNKKSKNENGGDKSQLKSNTNYHMMSTNEVFYEHKRSTSKHTSSNYSAEALIGNQNSEEIDKKLPKPTGSSSFLTENIITYFPTVEENYMVPNQNFQNTTLTTNSFPNSTYSTNSFSFTAPTISTYLSNNLDATAHDFVPDNLNLLPHVKDKKACANKNMKKFKKKLQNDGNISGLTSFEYPFLSMPCSTNSPVLPDDFHSHANFLPPTTPYPCKNSLYQKQSSDFNGLPLPVMPRSNIQHPEVSPSINSVGTSLTNFNLSTIFPEINKVNTINVYPDTHAKEHSNAVSLQVPFNTEPKYNFST